MKSRDFCYWLQGFFELRALEPEPNKLKPEQVDMIKKHLHLVFAHEIDPSFPDAEKLKEIHDPPNEKKEQEKTVIHHYEHSPKIMC